MGGKGERAGFRDVFAVSEFRAAWAAQMLSVAGDQLARVALTLLVYDRTHSAALAAVTFVAGMLPSLVGGTLLSGLGDRFPRRTVMIVCDMVRAALVLIMVIPGLPLVMLVLHGHGAQVHMELRRRFRSEPATTSHSRPVVRWADCWMPPPKPATSVNSDPRMTNSR